MVYHGRAQWTGYKCLVNTLKSWAKT